MKIVPSLNPPCAATAAAACRRHRVSRWSALLATALLAFPWTLPAQTPAPRATPADDKPAANDIILLSPFEVNTDRDTGFAAASALAGGRLATSLKDTPVAYSVINRELIDALGITDLTAASDWTTNSFRYPDGAGGGDTFNITSPIAVRSILSNNPLRQRNFFIYYSENDTYNIERFDFGRGPNQVLFGNGTVGGMQISMTKRARFDRPVESLEATYGSWKNKRVVADINRPLTDKIAVRAAAVWADREGWRDNEMEKKKSVFLTGTFKLFRQTELRLEGERGKIERRIPDAKLNDRLGGWDGVTYGDLLATLPSNSGALGIDRRGGNYFIYNPASGPNSVMQLDNWAMTRGAGDTATTPAGGLFQVGQVSWNQSSATILNAQDVVPGRFATALAKSKFFIPSREFTNAPETPLISSNYYDLQATLNRQFGNKLFLEIAGDVNRVKSDINRFEADSITTYIDINQTLPGGQTNPNFLRPYGDGRYFYTLKDTKAKSVRAAAAYLLDLGNWGNYSFNLMGGLSHQSIGTRNRDLSPGVTTGQLADRRQWGQLGNSLRQRLYWGDPHPYVVPAGSINYISNTGVTSTATPTWTPAIADDSSNNISDNDNDYNYILAAMNAKFFKGRLVLLGAMRYDDSQQAVKYLVRAGDFPSDWDGRSLYWRPNAPADWSTLQYTPVGATTPIYAITRPRTNNSFGVPIANPAYANARFTDDFNPPPVVAKVWKPSTGAVYHVPGDWLSVFGNYSKAISFNTAAAPDVNGRLLPAVVGKGWDAGVRFILLKERLNFSVTTYNNEEYGNYIDPTSVTNQINTLYQANVFGDTTIGGRNRRNAADINGLVRDTRTRIAKGYEMELVANLTRAWRVTANVGLPDVQEKGTAPMTRAYVAANDALFRQVLDDAGGTVGADGIAVLKAGITDTGNNGSESTGNEATRAVNAYNNIYANNRNFVVNARTATNVVRTFNIFTDYTFQDTKLKGLRLSAGVNYRGSRVVGYRGGDSIVNPANPLQSIDDPSLDGYSTVVAPGATLVSASVGYTWHLQNRRDLSLTLRVNNLLNEDDVIWTDNTSTLRPKGGNFASPARETVYNPYAYQTPRNFSVTVRFTF